MNHFDRLGRIYWHAYAALAILLFLFWGGQYVYVTYIREPQIFITPNQDDSVSLTQPDLKRKVDHTLHNVNVNTSPVWPLRRLGFTYYEICQILQFRQYGFRFDSVPDLLCIKYLDSVHLYSVAHQLAFSVDTSLGNNGLNINDLFRLRDDFYRQASQQRFDNSSSRSRRGRSVPLFLADSVEMLSAGLSPQAWDTLAAYQRAHILRGSAPVDSLITLTPQALGSFLASRSSGLRSARQSPSPQKVIPIVELNAATPEQLVQLPYVGSRSAEAIIEYRQRLGGFVSPRQLLEVWTVDSARFEKMAPYVIADSSGVRRINVNSSNDTRMRRHPYFSPSIVGRLAQTRLRKRRRQPLAMPDVRQAVAGENISPFFWSYVAYSE